MASIVGTVNNFRKLASKASNPPGPASYGFPPPPKALCIPTPHKSVQKTAIPTPSPSMTTPVSSPIEQSPTSGDEPKYSANLAEYLAKNPGISRLYNNHGSIKRPACVECHNSRKKCDLERPCGRCVKFKLACIERPPRGKRKRTEDIEPHLPAPKNRPPTSHKKRLNTGLPSPVYESGFGAQANAHQHTRPHIKTPYNTALPPPRVVQQPTEPLSPMELDVTLQRPPPASVASTNVFEMSSVKSRLSAVIDCLSEYLPCPPFTPECFDLPMPEINHFTDMSQQKSSVPIFGLEGGHIQHELALQMENDLNSTEDTITFQLSNDTALPDNKFTIQPDEIFTPPDDKNITQPDSAFDTDMQLDFLPPDFLDDIMNSPDLGDPLDMSWMDFNYNNWDEVLPPSNAP
ncbi:hypothetical protein DFH27DRAFT_608777 [Peziza echinospora]|nr:hypothetical protein DFH27DRAFT_608777 [Peziza echinospora]